MPTHPSEHPGVISEPDGRATTLEERMEKLQKVLLPRAGAACLA